MTIKTEYWPKPIPSRQFDWEAWDDDEELCKIGHGLTEQDAIDDLKQQLELKEDAE